MAQNDFPVIGLGTAMLRGEKCIEVVHNALSIGYRMIDTALLYGNQVNLLIS